MCVCVCVCVRVRWCCDAARWGGGTTHARAVVGGGCMVEVYAKNGRTRGRGHEGRKANLKRKKEANLKRERERERERE